MDPPSLAAAVRAHLSAASDAAQRQKLEDTTLAAAVPQVLAPEAAVAATAWLNSVLRRTFDDVQQHSMYFEGKLLLPVAKFEENATVQDFESIDGIVRLAVDRKIVYKDVHYDTRAPVVVAYSSSWRDATPNDFTIKQFLACVRPDVPRGPQRSARATQRRPQDIRDAESRSARGTVERARTGTYTLVPADEAGEEHEAAMDYDSGTIRPRTVTATHPPEEEDGGVGVVDDRTFILGAVKHRPARIRTNTIPDSQGVVRTSPVSSVIVGEQDTIKTLPLVDRRAAAELVQQTESLAKAGVDVESVAKFDILMWGDTMSISTLKAVTVDAIAAAGASAAPAAAASSAPLPPPSAQDDAWQQASPLSPPSPATQLEVYEAGTLKVKMMLEEQYRKRPELDVNWAAFSLPELENFLHILAAEEQMHRQHIISLCNAKRINLQRQLDEIVVAQQTALDAAEAELAALDVSLSAQAGTTDSPSTDAAATDPAPVAAAASSSANENANVEAAPSSIRRQRTKVISRGSRRSERGLLHSVIDPGRSILAAEAAAQQDGLKDASLLLSAGAADDAPVISAASSTLPNLPTNASGRRFGESARRRKHISLYVDDFVGEEGALQPVPSLLDGELDPGRRAAYWLDEQLRLVISTLRAVGTPLRDANSLGLVSCSWSLLQERCTGVVHLAGTLLTALERGIVEYSPNRMLDEDGDADVEITLLRDAVPTANSQTYQMRILRRSMRLRGTKKRAALPMKQEKQESVV